MNFGRVAVFALAQQNPARGPGRQSRPNEWRCTAADGAKSALQSAVGARFRMAAGRHPDACPQRQPITLNRTPGAPCLPATSHGLLRTPPGFTGPAPPGARNAGRSERGWHLCWRLRWRWRRACPLPAPGRRMRRLTSCARALLRRRRAKSTVCWINPSTCSPPSRAARCRGMCMR